MNCPLCGSQTSQGESLIGRLGWLLHFRCRYCGGMWNKMAKPKKMKKLGVLCSIILTLAIGIGTAEAKNRVLSQAEENRIMMKVAHQKELDSDETRLLLAIRTHEDGPTGMEFGIGQEVWGHRSAKRYRNDPRKSLALQAEWAAGTIQKRFNGSLRQFSTVWCPKGSATWYRSVSNIMMTKYATVPDVSMTAAVNPAAVKPVATKPAVKTAKKVTPSTNKVYLAFLKSEQKKRM